MPKYKFPKFYLKRIGNETSIEHRLTHTFLESTSSMTELKKAMEKWTGMTEKELWEYLILKRHVSIPEQRSSTFFSKNHDGDESAEKWFDSAWSSFTDEYYDLYPQFLQEQDQFPYEVINEVRREKYKAQKLLDDKLKAEREELARQYKEDMETAKELASAKKEVAVGVLDNPVSLDRGVQELKKRRRKVVVKSKVGKEAVFNDSVDLFD